MCQLRPIVISLGGAGNETNKKTKDDTDELKYPSKPGSLF